MRKMNWIQKKSDKKTVIIVGAVLLLLVLLIVSGVCLLRDKQDPEPTLEEIVDSKLNAYQTDLADSMDSLKTSRDAGVQHLLHLKSKSKILRPIEIMGFFYEFFCQIQGNNLL